MTTVYVCATIETPNKFKGGNNQTASFTSISNHGRYEAVIAALRVGHTREASAGGVHKRRAEVTCTTVHSSPACSTTRPWQRGRTTLTKTRSGIVVKFCVAKPEPACQGVGLKWFNAFSLSSTTRRHTLIEHGTSGSGSSTFSETGTELRNCKTS